MTVLCKTVFLRNISYGFKKNDIDVYGDAFFSGRWSARWDADY